MDFRILYLTLSTLQGILAFCTVSKDQCTHTLNCVDYVEAHSYEFVKLPYEEYPLLEYEWYECPTNVTYNGVDYFNVRLIYAQSGMSLEPIPMLQDSNGILINIVSSLDLSHNSYYMTPAIVSMRNLGKLDLSRNYLTTAVLSNINKLTSLSEIDLSHNMISTIQVRSTEYSYINLTKINISQNKLMKIDEKTFDEFQALQKVNLSYNFINTISKQSFEYNKDITELDISNNLLKSINSSLVYLKQLQYLNISGNKIENIQPNEFERLVKLETLDLSYNLIKEINVNALQNTVLLKNINLSNNLLESIDNKTFSSLKSLITIDISSNKLKSLPVGLFKDKILNYIFTENKLEGSLVKGMFEHVDAEEINLSYECLTEIQNYAFHHLTNLKVLLLNSNQIKTLSNNSFESLINLKVLNLSDNQISNLNFDKKDLANLQYLFLQNNRLAEINYKEFDQLINLKQLNLSGNLISHVGLNIFRSLKYLMSFDISNNSLVGTLNSKTFDGLDSIPILDISNCMLIKIENASFNDMTELKVLNISRCLISELQFNVFVNTGHIETLDLSYNKMQNFSVNTSDLSRLVSLFLNNNLIKTISTTTLNKLPRLKILDLSHNEIQFISNCTDFTADDSSAVESRLKAIVHLLSLHFLNLSHNNISVLQIGDLTRFSSLKYLDLSFNRISLIQPGAFKSNMALVSLNISHNLLTTVNYGIFRGLSQLNVLNISYNNLKELQSEIFFDTQKLTWLIADFNEIESINTLDTFSTHLNKLSIGDNPLSCEILVKHERRNLPLEITSIRISEHGQENVNGVVCNKFRVTEHTAVTDNKDDKYVYSESPEVSKVLYHKQSNIEYFNNNTNVLLEKIEKSFIKYFDSINNSKSQLLNTSSNQNTKSVVTEVCIVLILLILISMVLYYFSKSRLIKTKFNYRVSKFSENEENSTL